MSIIKQKYAIHNVFVSFQHPHTINIILIDPQNFLYLVRFWPQNKQPVLPHEQIETVSSLLLYILVESICHMDSGRHSNIQ